MTTPNNQPTPPEGYRTPTKAELECLPEGSIVFDYDHKEWDPSCRCSYSAQLGCFYAIPITPTVPATGDAHDCMGDDSPTLTEINCVFGAAQATGDTTNEKGGEQELLPCPFCKSLDATVNQWGVNYVECGNEDCKAFGPSAETEEQAIIKWNTRK